ncbi:NUDIX hydrolase [Virgisporangium aurantiacum]|uniref:NUDIX hydrolase n=1 Tax=Virgisporangium aurantiacum TaxID=175570 RepID=UPI001EF3C151|nr:NUDIX domain-containing protein [Virgisporangium aurantiacum]
MRSDDLNILLVQRRKAPFKGQWALPGGGVKRTEDLVDAARRELQEETGIRHAQLDQRGIYATPGRDPRGHVISVTWLALLPDLTLPTAGSDAKAACWRPVRDAAPLAFDHDEIVRDSLEHVRGRLEHTPMAVDLCVVEFTITELRTVYEAVWNTQLDRRNFHRRALRIPGFLDRTDRYRIGSTGAPAPLYTRGNADTLHPPLLRPRRPSPRSNPTPDGQGPKP